MLVVFCGQSFWGTGSCLVDIKIKKNCLRTHRQRDRPVQGPTPPHAQRKEGFSQVSEC